MFRSFVPVALLVFVPASAYMGCSDEETDPPRTRSDAGSTATGDAGGTTPDSGTATPTDSGTSTPTDSATPGTDSGGQDLCTAYCQCMDTTCAGKVSDCATQCAANKATWDLTCRTQHCGYAKTMGAGTHCPHAAGENTCP